MQFDVVVLSRPRYLTQRCINRYEAQIRSGTHLCINGMGATGPASSSKIAS